MAHVRNHNKYLLTAFLLYSVFSHAETGSAWDLDNLQKQRVLYEAKAALNKAKAEAEGNQYNSGSQVNAFPSGSATITPVQSSESFPQLVKINGRNAVISMPDGSTTTVSVGQMLPGGRWQVLSIGLNGVKIKNISSQRTQILN